MERRLLPALVDHNLDIGAFATKWEGWRNPPFPFEWRARTNVRHPDAIDDIDNAMGLYVVLYEPSGDGSSRYVVYVGYSKVLSSELKIRYGKWEANQCLHPSRSRFPFATLYISSKVKATKYEDFLIRYYCPPWNTRFHR